MYPETNLILTACSFLTCDEVNATRFEMNLWELIVQIRNFRYIFTCPGTV
jgi:hypothetical protein